MAHDSLARRLERSQALLNEHLNRAAGGQSLAVGGGFAHSRGPSHPLNQALGLIDPVSERELEAVEAFLGAPTVLELSPAAAPTLWPLLAHRGYRLHSFQQLLVRKLDDRMPLDARVQVRVARAEEGLMYNRIVAAGFQEHDDWRVIDPPFEVSLSANCTFGFLVFAGTEPAGGGMLGVVEGVALLAGDSVLPRFRGRGLQKALIRARLAFAAQRGCDVACGSTAPGTASQRSFEGCGFRVAYPKVEMARG